MHFPLLKVGGRSHFRRCVSVVEDKVESSETRIGRKSGIELETRRF